MFSLFEYMLTDLYLLEQTYPQKKFGVPALEQNACELQQPTQVLFSFLSFFFFFVI